jgi:flagellar transcriptional activator FlhC
VLEAETNISRERLLKLYKEVRGESPPKGMLPFSTDWFMSWQPNIHSSLFIDIHRYLTGQCGVTRTEAIIKAYRLYLEHVQVHGLEQVLSLTRAWSLVRFIEARMLTTVPCTECSGHFVVHTMDLHQDYVRHVQRALACRQDQEEHPEAVPAPPSAPAAPGDDRALDAAVARLSTSPGRCARLPEDAPGNPGTPNRGPFRPFSTLRPAVPY